MTGVKDMTETKSKTRARAKSPGAKRSTEAAKAKPAPEKTLKDAGEAAIVQYPRLCFCVSCAILTLTELAFLWAPRVFGYADIDDVEWHNSLVCVVLHAVLTLKVEAAGLSRDNALIGMLWGVALRLKTAPVKRVMYSKEFVVVADTIFPVEFVNIFAYYCEECSRLCVRRFQTNTCWTAISVIGTLLQIWNDSAKLYCFFVLYIAYHVLFYTHSLNSYAGFLF
jgi:hypothetical protein